jgi:hypothetical protein
MKLHAAVALAFGLLAVAACTSGAAQPQGQDIDGTTSQPRDKTDEDARASAVDPPACAPGGHPCGGETSDAGAADSGCVVDSPDSCGDLCKTCPEVANGAATCEAGNCGFTCAAGFGPSSGKCLALVTCWRDADGDGFGDPATVDVFPGACPTGYIERTLTAREDCHDGNPAVFPGQTAFFTTGYTKGNAPPSFDYDCNGAEAEESPLAPKASPAMGCVYIDGSCRGAGGGWLKTDPRGQGANLYCGSTTVDRPVCTARSAFHCRLDPGTIVREDDAAPIACH